MHPLAGKRTPRELLVDVPRLISSYYTETPDKDNAAELVAFGTSGHRGSSLKNNFNEHHILAICQAIAEYRHSQGITGPLYLGMDTHALSEPARATAIEVLAANGVSVVVDEGLGYTPTPVISHAILRHNAGRTTGLADGIIITPSHNPPEDGGLKYNPPHGGPADTNATSIIQSRANEIIKSGMTGVKRLSLRRALNSDCVTRCAYATPYIADLINVVDLKCVGDVGLSIGVDPMGGAALHYWDQIASHYNLNLHVTNDVLDPSFAFMSLDKDGKIRMDCSSCSAMASLITLRADYDIAFGNDPDADRHGIVTKSSGLMNPNHYISVAVSYLFQNRSHWRKDAAIGKTLVSSSMIDRVAAQMGRRLSEVPVGFKWFVDGLLDGALGFGGEESAGASFVRTNGSVWTTDKDGLIMGLLAAEITAVTGSDPGEHYKSLEAMFGSPVYERIDAPATPAQQIILKNLTVDRVQATELAGDKIIAKLTKAPGNNADIGGLKVVTESGWFAARPSGTEHIYKIYAESFKGQSHLAAIQEEAQSIVDNAITPVVN